MTMFIGPDETGVLLEVGAVEWHGVAERELADAVHAAREKRLSWLAVGEAIGTSSEAARQRYSRSS